MSHDKVLPTNSSCLEFMQARIHRCTVYVLSVSVCLHVSGRRQVVGVLLVVQILLGFVAWLSSFFACLPSLFSSGLFPLFFPCAQSSTKPYAYVGCSCSALFWQRLSSLVFEQASVTSTSAPPWFKCSLVYRHCSLFTFVNEFELLQVLLKPWQEPRGSQVYDDSRFTL